MLLYLDFSDATRQLEKIGNHSYFRSCPYLGSYVNIWVLTIPYLHNGQTRNEIRKNFFHLGNFLLELFLYFPT